MAVREKTVATVTGCTNDCRDLCKRLKKRNNRKVPLFSHTTSRVDERVLTAMKRRANISGYETTSKYHRLSNYARVPEAMKPCASTSGYELYTSTITFENQRSTADGRLPVYMHPAFTLPTPWQHGKDDHKTGWVTNCTVTGKTMLPPLNYGNKRHMNVVVPTYRHS